MSDPVIHIMEPTACSVYGHHFVYCERAAEFFYLRGYDTVSYFAWRGGGDRELRERARRAKFTFQFRYGRAFERCYGGDILDTDPIERVSVRRAKQAIQEADSTATIEQENMLWRLRYDMDTVTGDYAFSDAETLTLEEASDDIAEWIRLLRLNYHNRNNVLFLPTGEFFLFHALIEKVGDLAGRVGQIHIRMWNFLSLERNGANLVDLAFKLQRVAAEQGVSVFLYAETDWACRHLALRSSTPVGYLDINSFSEISIDDALQESAARSRSEPPERLRVFFPGSYRRFPDKGLGFLRELLLQAPFPAHLQIVIQEPDYRAVRIAPETLSANPQVTVLPRILDDGAYQAEFKLADIICTPYDHVTWPDQFRGSGVILEALLAAKPTIVTANTPLARYAETYEIGVVGDCAQFLKLTRDFDLERQFKQAAENARKYAGTLARNPMLETLPPPLGPGMLRFIDDQQQSPAANGLSEGGEAMRLVSRL